MFPQRVFRPSGELASVSQGGDAQRRAYKSVQVKYPRPETAVVCLDPHGELNKDGRLPTCGSKITVTEIPELR